jgi:hypothetical protein
MRRLAFAPQVCVLVFAIVAAACGSGNISGGNQPDAKTGNCNGGICDAPLQFDARFLGCADPGGSPCPTGQVCYLDRCFNDTCVAHGDAGAACMAGEVCSAKCIPTHDLCEGVTCAADETCQNGQCAPGCFAPSACIGKTCGSDEFCQNGVCQKINPCDLPCGAGLICNASCHAPGPCDNVDCVDPHTICIPTTLPDGGVTGACVTNSCIGVTCEGGQVCSNGVCVDTCAGECPCTPPAICIQNHCVNQCVPDCDPAHGKHCGSDDGCDHKCRIQDCGAGMTCDATDTCVCAPDCGATKHCGDDDGCGHKCNLPCGGNETCDPNQGCVCNNTTCNGACCGTGQGCVDGACCAAAATCEAGAPDLCCNTGNCFVDGTGVKELCCAPASYCLGSGTDCCSGTDSVCNTVGATKKCCARANALCSDGNCCPSGQCFAKEGTTDKNKCCSNAGNYCSKSDICCDGTGFCNGDETHCCAPGKTGDYCANLEGGAACCGPNEKCKNEANGTDQLCCTENSWCTDSKKCCATDKNGRPLSNPFCFNDNDQMPNNDACCNADELVAADGSCCSKGDVLNGGQCCTPSCPANSTCGVTSNGCGGTCSGFCDAGSTCTQTGQNPPAYQCKVDECHPACGCGEYCVAGVCQPLCPPTETLCGCGVCCPNGCADPATGRCNVNG